jgi:hypothetical protein
MLNFRPNQTMPLGGFNKTASELNDAMRDIISGSRAPAPAAQLFAPANHVKVAAVEKTAEEAEADLMSKIASSEHGTALIKVSSVYGRLLAHLEIAQATGNQAGIKTASDELADFVTLVAPAIIKRAAENDKKHKGHKKHEKSETKAEEKAEAKTESHEGAAPPTHEVGQAAQSAGPSVY